MCVFQLDENQNEESSDSNPNDNVSSGLHNYLNCHLTANESMENIVRLNRNAAALNSLAIADHNHRMDSMIDAHLSEYKKYVKNTLNFRRKSVFIFYCVVKIFHV